MFFNLKLQQPTIFHFKDLKKIIDFFKWEKNPYQTHYHSKQRGSLIKCFQSLNHKQFNDTLVTSSPDSSSVFMHVRILLEILNRLMRHECGSVCVSLLKETSDRDSLFILKAASYGCFVNMSINTPFGRLSRRRAQRKKSEEQHHIVSREYHQTENT